MNCKMNDSYPLFIDAEPVISFKNVKLLGNN